MFKESRHVNVTAHLASRLYVSCAADSPSGQVEESDPGLSLEGPAACRSGRPHLPTAQHGRTGWMGSSFTLVINGPVTRD